MPANGARRRFVLDQTEHRRAECERQEVLAREHAALAEAEEANRAKDRFLAGCPRTAQPPLAHNLGGAGAQGHRPRQMSACQNAFAHHRQERPPRSASGG